MTTLLVLYKAPEGGEEALATLESRYRDEHMPLVAQTPGLRSTRVWRISEALGGQAEHAFAAAYGRPPNSETLVDAIAAYERSLVTPGSRFDQWLQGNNTYDSERLEGTSTASCQPTSAVPGRRLRRLTSDACARVESDSHPV